MLYYLKVICMNIFMTFYKYLHDSLTFTFPLLKLQTPSWKIFILSFIVKLYIIFFYAFHQPIIILTVFHFSQSRPRKQLPAYHWLGSSREWMVELINRHSYQQSPVPPLNCGCQPINSPLNFKHLGTIVSHVGAPWALFFQR